MTPHAPKDRSVVETSQLSDRRFPEPNSEGFLQFMGGSAEDLYKFLVLNTQDRPVGLPRLTELFGFTPRRLTYLCTVLQNLQMHGHVHHMQMILPDVGVSSIFWIPNQKFRTSRWSGWSYNEDTFLQAHLMDAPFRPECVLPLDAIEGDLLSVGKRVKPIRVRKPQRAQKRKAHAEDNRSGASSYEDHHSWKPDNSGPEADLRDLESDPFDPMENLS